MVSPFKIHFSLFRFLNVIQRFLVNILILIHGIESSNFYLTIYDFKKTIKLNIVSSITLNFGFIISKSSRKHEKLEGEKSHLNKYNK